jgi:hypothetical protein
VVSISASTLGPGICSAATAAGVGTKNFAPDSGVIDGAAGLLNDVAALKAVAPLPLLNVSTYLQRRCYTPLK